MIETNPYRIFLVEDDGALAEEMAGQLSKYGYKVRTVEDFERVMAEFGAFDPHLVILDVNLPHSDGYRICRELRALTQLPILFVSGRSSSMDMVMGLGMGGDDYLTKPFAMEVLTARIQALLRRSYAYTDTRRELIEYKGLILNLNDGTIQYRGHSSELTRNEFRLLRELVEHRGTILSRDRLMEALWSSDIFVDDNTLTVNINRLRKRLEAIGIRDLIVTRKNQGYLAE